eukprot:CAMPEP_0177606590 /NCGR_PEP_ID=MMETSP0419_2-20121207/17391_1 /TAXON_ID=582737 /ORGANISM="Tetraselmis sp., Strain GSL018" /LENGTH=66 /DNA_ID=CAMNT_0019100967 /DNA_START=1966 /DNA_END=2163 /DNA_ORIENTATION=-
MVTNKVVKITYTLKSQIDYFGDELLQVPLNSARAILGQSWLKKYNPTINKKRQTMMLQELVLLEKW